MSHFFSDEMQSVIEGSVGMSLKDIKEKDVEEIQGSIEERSGEKIELSKEPRHSLRGNILIQMGRTITSNEIDDNFNKHFR